MKRCFNTTLASETEVLFTKVGTYSITNATACVQVKQRTIQQHARELLGAAAAHESLLGTASTAALRDWRRHSAAGGVIPADGERTADGR